MSDTIKKPDHYMVGGIETIEYLKAKLTASEFEGYCRGNVLKYLSRAPHKNGVEDYQKAQVYLGWLIEAIKRRNHEANGEPLLL